jgi:hypothetical protein
MVVEKNQSKWMSSNQLVKKWHFDQIGQWRQKYYKGMGGKGFHTFSIKK